MIQITQIRTNFPICSPTCDTKNNYCNYEKVLISLPLFLFRFLRTWSATKTSNAPFLTPDEAITNMKTLKGFEVKAFVAEPDIGEAIAFCFDFRGRLWTLENYNYQTRKAHSADKRNRIQIFEDLDGDGVFEEKDIY